MKKLKNSLILTTIIPLFSITMLATSISNAQQLNQVRAFIAPTMTPTTKQKSYFPSEQQIQQALLEHVAVPPSSFPPLAQQAQVFINQFSTPDAPRLRSIPQFAAPIQMFNSNPIANSAMQKKYNALNRGYRQQTMKFPGVQRSSNGGNGNNFPSNLGSNNTNPFSFPVMPFANNKGLSLMHGGNNKWGNIGNDFPFVPKISNSNRKKSWGNKRNIWPDFYTDFTDTAWDESMGVPRKLGRMPGGWRFPYISTPDPVTVSDAVTNQFPPIAEEAGHMVDISKWGVFDN